MQKAFIAITLALTLTCAFAGYTPQNWVKPPVAFLADTDSNFTFLNTSASFSLGGMTTSDVNVIGSNVTLPSDLKNLSISSWKVWTKTITTKDLSSSANTSYTYTSPVITGIQYGYAVGLVSENDTNNVPQIFLYQLKINGGTVLPRIAITSNTNASWTPLPLGGAGAAWKTMAFFYIAAATGKVNYTSITIGGSSMGKEFTLSTTWNMTAGPQNKDGISCDWGEALSSSQIFCAYTEAGVYKVAVVDFSAGTYIGQAAVGAPYGSTFSCSPYVTDKKYYGLLCQNTTNVNGTAYQTYFVSSNTTNTLVQLGNSTNVYNMSVQSYRDMHQYGPYLAIFYTNPSATNVEISYDLWDTYANSQVQAKKIILNYDAVSSKFDQYTIPQGGMYGLLWNFNATTGVRTSVQVGQIMGASYLTTVFGALMTIVAGLFLF